MLFCGQKDTFARFIIAIVLTMNMATFKESVQAGPSYKSCGIMTPFFAHLYAFAAVKMVKLTARVVASLLDARP